MDPFALAVFVSVVAESLCEEECGGFREDFSGTLGDDGGGQA